MVCSTGFVVLCCGVLNRVNRVVLRCVRLCLSCCVVVCWTGLIMLWYGVFDWVCHVVLWCGVLDWFGHAGLCSAGFCRVVMCVG